MSGSRKNLEKLGPRERRFAPTQMNGDCDRSSSWKETRERFNCRVRGGARESVLAQTGSGLAIEPLARLFARVLVDALLESRFLRSGKQNLRARAQSERLSR